MHSPGHSAVAENRLAGYILYPHSQCAGAAPGLWHPCITLQDFVPRLEELWVHLLTEEDLDAAVEYMLTVLAPPLKTVLICSPSRRAEELQAARVAEAVAAMRESNPGLQQVPCWPPSGVEQDSSDSGDSSSDDEA